MIGQLPAADMEDLIKIKWTRLDSDPHALEDVAWKIVPVNIVPKDNSTDTSGVFMLLIYFYSINVKCKTDKWSRIKSLMMLSVPIVV